MLAYPLLFGSLGFWEIVLIVLVILLLFGGKKIPELMRGLGKGVKSFKQGMNEVEKEIRDVEKELDKPADKPEGNGSAKTE
ncbi:MAG: twin-arginine translocase TatA/TatE family subunit [Bacteroidia bacterium]|nr:twin-arginine translocase TatA/TatE family subunit [Bacteroidia bacterium]